MTQVMIAGAAIEKGDAVVFGKDGRIYTYNKTEEQTKITEDEIKRIREHYLDIADKMQKGKV